MYANFRHHGFLKTPKFSWIYTSYIDPFSVKEKIRQYISSKLDLSHLYSEVAIYHYSLGHYSHFNQTHVHPLSLSIYLSISPSLTHTHRASVPEITVYWKFIKHTIKQTLSLFKRYFKLISNS